MQGKKTIIPAFGDPTDLGFVLEATPQLDPNHIDYEYEVKLYYIN